MSRGAPPGGHGRGAIVLAAYQPDPALFATQLRTIQAQTYGDFDVLVGADGGVDDVRALVRETVGEDQRFSVVGWDDNVGFYLNFERLLELVPLSSAWVALSDHDDRWQEDKLERLLPLLRDNVLVTGQARVVELPSGRVLSVKTGRKVVAPRDLLLHNQVSGALCVFRRELLAVALPFPRLQTVTQVHDHWLAMCAVAVDGYAVLDEVVQDYVQHGGNEIGEVEVSRAPWTPARVVRRLHVLATQYEGSSTPRSWLLAASTLSFGWRRVMLLNLVDRVSPAPPWLTAVSAPLHPAHRLRRLRVVADGFRSGDVANSVVATFVAGLPGELMWSVRHEPVRASAVTAPARRGEGL